MPVRSHLPIRLDVYIRESLIWKSRQRIQELIRAGNITVNDRTVKPSQAVKSGDLIRIRLSMGTGVPVDYHEFEPSILYEDRWIVAVDKPPGMLVHPVGRHVYDTLLNYLHFRYLPKKGEATGDGKANSDRHQNAVEEAPTLLLCHRIDRDTTGVLLIAKDEHVHQRLTAQFEEREVHKEYLALCCGHLAPGAQVIDVPLGEGPTLALALTPPTKAASTEVEPIEQFTTPAGSFTLVAARPFTGRQNQIRIHLAFLGHPIVGDWRYGTPAPVGFPQRYLLHAREIRVVHPRLRTGIRIEAAPPEDFAELLTRLRGANQESRGSRVSATG